MERKWFGRDPALVIQGIGALLTLLVVFRAPGWDDHLVASITALLAAVATAWTALNVRPIAPTVFNGVVVVLATLVSSYWGHLSQTQVGAITLTLTAFMAILTRAQQSPVPV